MTDNVTAVRTKIDWSILSGVILEGGYELKEVLEGRETAARLRVRILGSGGKTGVAYFMHLAPADAEDQLDIWNTLREAPHPNLSKPAALGKREVGGVKTIYLVLTDPDEKLAAVIPERPLEWEEAAEVLHACEKGLAHLHAHGLLHGAVSPQTVEAVGYSVQLSTENVHRVGQTPRIEWQKPQYLAPESKNLNLTTAADVWCLGATLFEVLSQERYGTAGVELEQGLPLAAVIYRCLDKNPLTRCTLKEAPVIEQNSAQAPPAAKPEPVPIPQPVAPPSAAPPPAPAAPPPPQPLESKSAPAYTPTVPPAPIPPRGAPTTATRTTSSSRLPQPLTPKEPPNQVTKEDMALVPIGKRHKKVQRQPVGARIRTLDGPDQDHPIGEAISTVLGPTVSARITELGHKSTLARNIGAVAGLAAILAAAVWFIVLPKLKSIDEPMTSMAPIQISDDSVTIAPDGKPAGATPQTADPSSRAPMPANSAALDDTPAPPKQYVGYRVVVGAFNSREDALHELTQLSQQHPELILHIVKMNVESANNQIKTVVTVGGTLDQTEAQPLLDRCLKKGLKSAHLERVQIERIQR
jgi:serine/threonine protein kinase